MNRLTLLLPFPPSVNCLYAGKKRRYKSDRYKAWIKEASLYINAAQPIEGRVDILYEFDIPNKVPRDADNYAKAVTDLLVSQGVIKDDSYKFVRQVTCRWSDKRGKEFRVTIESAPPCPDSLST